MKHLRTMIVIAASLLLVAAVATAAAPERTGAGSGEARSAWGLCKAWENNVQGRAHGDAENATAFRWLREQAGNATVEEHCSAVPHPRDARRGAGEGPIGNATAPEDAGGNVSAPEDASGNATTAAHDDGRRGQGPRHASGDGPPHGKAKGHGRADHPGQGG